MFAELPKLFDRNFAIAYVLPMAFFVAATSGLIWLFDVFPKILQLALADLVKTAAVIGLISFFGGTVLLALNRNIYRLMEGYNNLNPFGPLIWIERRRYKNLQEELSQLDEEYRQLREHEKEIPSKLQSKRSKLMQRIAETFPDHIDFVLPTAFGNTIRAFEVYPRVMYGSDSIVSWSRLLTVLPKEYRDLVDSAKAQVDFWLNLWLLSLVFVIECIVLSIYRSKYEILWFIPVALVLICFVVSVAKEAVIGWGDYVKAAYDVFLPKLASTMEVPLPIDREKEWELWTAFTHATLYRLPDSLPNRTQLQPSESNIDTKDRGNSTVQLTSANLTKQHKQQ